MFNLQTAKKVHIGWSSKDKFRMDIFSHFCKKTMLCPSLELPKCLKIFFVVE